MNKELYDHLVTAAADYRARGDEAAAARIEHSLRSYREQEPQISRETFEKSNPPPQGVSFDETLNHYMCGSSGSLHARDSYQLLWAAWQVRVALERADAAELKLAASDYTYDSARNHDRSLVNELNVLLNGTAGAAEQASLSDLVAQVAGVVQEEGRPILQLVQPGGGVGQLHGLDKQCRDDVARALGLTPHGDGYAWSALLADINTAAKIAQAGEVPMEWRSALERLEQACEVRAALTSSDAYNAAVLTPGLSDALLEIDNARKAARELLAAPPVALAGQASLDVRLKAAGMFTIDEVLKGLPLDSFIKHAAVTDMVAFAKWLEMKRAEILRLHASFELGDRKDDEMHERVLAQMGVLAEVHINFKAAIAGQSALETSTPLVVGTLLLGGVDGTELGDIDFQIKSKVVEAIQSELVTTAEDVQVEVMLVQEHNRRFSNLAILLGGALARVHELEQAMGREQEGKDLAALRAELAEGHGHCQMTVWWKNGNSAVDLPINRDQYGQILRILDPAVADAAVGFHAAVSPAAQTAEASPTVVALLRNIVEGEVGRWNLSKLDDGQGTDTDDGRNWLAAREFVRGLPGSILRAPLPKSVRAWFDAKLAHINAVEAYNTRLAYVRQHLPFGASVDPEYQLMEQADRNARSLVGPMFEELRGLIGEGGLPAASAGEEAMRGLVAFVQELIKGALDGGNFDGGDIQESAERHGVLTKKVMTQSCAGPEGDCPCAWSAGFPAECYRINPAVLALVGGEAGKARQVDISDSGRIN
ncbi:TPA: hypothetical protein ACKRQV_000079 [Pseudomonas aeruginosa]